MTPTPKGESVDDLRTSAQMWLQRESLDGPRDVIGLMAAFAREVVRERAAEYAVSLNELLEEIARLKGELERISVRSDELESFYDEHTLEIARLKRRVEAGERLGEAAENLLIATDTPGFSLFNAVPNLRAALSAWDAAKDPCEGEE